MSNQSEREVSTRKFGEGPYFPIRLPAGTNNLNKWADQRNLGDQPFRELEILLGLVTDSRAAALEAKAIAGKLRGTLPPEDQHKQLDRVITPSENPDVAGRRYSYTIAVCKLQQARDEFASALSLLIQHIEENGLSNRNNLPGYLPRVPMLLWLHDIMCAHEVQKKTTTELQDLDLYLGSLPRYECEVEKAFGGVRFDYVSKGRRN